MLREDAGGGRQLLAGDAGDQESLAREVLAGGDALVDALGRELEGVAPSLLLGLFLSLKLSLSLRLRVGPGLCLRLLLGLGVGRGLRLGVSRRRIGAIGYTVL